MDTLLSVDCERLGMPLVESAGWHDIVTAIPSVKRTTPAFHVTYVLRQETTWLIEPEERLFIQAGQLGLIAPGTPHQGAWAVDHPNQHVWFYFQPSVRDAERHTPLTRAKLDEISVALSRRGSCVVPVTRAMARLCEAIPERLQSATDNDYIWLRCIIAQIFLHSAEALMETSTSAPTQDIVRLVESRLLDWPNVAAVAAYFTMEPSQFHRLFKKATGMSPWNYILRARCRLGCDQPRRSPFSITTIAHDLGFSSSQHFSTVFRRLTGHTPGEFRRLYG